MFAVAEHTDKALCHEASCAAACPLPSTVFLAPDEMRGDNRIASHQGHYVNAVVSTIKQSIDMAQPHNKA